MLRGQHKAELPAAILKAELAHAARLAARNRHNQAGVFAAAAGKKLGNVFAGFIVFHIH